MLKNTGPRSRTVGAQGLQAGPCQALLPWRASGPQAAPPADFNPGQGLRMSGRETRCPLCHSGKKVESSGVGCELSERMCALRI